MIGINAIGSHCLFPRQPYSAADLPEEYHAEVLATFQRSALRDIWRAATAPDPAKDRIQTTQQRAGLRERAEEAAAAAYVRWLSLSGAEWMARGDHGRAIGATIRWCRACGWHPAGGNGMRRAARRAITEQRLAMRERLRARSVPTPAQIAEWGERLPADGGAGGLRAQRRRAERLAESLGLTADGLARLANGLAIEAGAARPHHTGQTPLPLPLPLPVGAHCPWGIGCDRSATTY
jgi:hypothetical protein